LAFTNIQFNGRCTRDVDWEQARCELVLNCSKGTKQFANEVRWRSWWHFWSTLAALVGSLTVASLEIPWHVRIPFGILAGLILVRLFIIYHDYQHGTILKGSRVAHIIMVSTPPIACAMGAYLFYAQYNFSDVKIRFGGEWNYVSAAGLIKLHPYEPNYALVHGQHWLSPCPSSQCPHSVLPPTRSYVCDDRVAIT